MARGSGNAELDRRPRRWRDFRPSVWTFVAPVAVAACVLVIVSIARDAGWIDKHQGATATRTTGSGASTQAGGVILYRVKKGETLMIVAVRYGIAIDRLRALNPALPKSGELTAGRRIRLR